MPRTIGVCSWSLQAGSPGELIERTLATGCRALQLHLDPLRTGGWSLAEVRDRARDAGVALRSGMMTMAGEDYSSLESIARTGGVRPGGTWAANRAAAEGNADAARELGIPLVTFHAGHLPADPGDPERGVMIERLRELIGVFGARGVRVGFETGQETAETLASYLDELPGAGVNFDPANMILYAMGDPVAALERLAPRVVQLHIKDARATETPGTWGDEVPAGEGEVDWRRFLDVAGARAPDADLMIEREAGASRVADITRARAMLDGLLGAAAHG